MGWGRFTRRAGLRAGVAGLAAAPFGREAALTAAAVGAAQEQLAAGLALGTVGAVVARSPAARSPGPPDLPGPPGSRRRAASRLGGVRGQLPLPARRDGAHVAGAPHDGQLDVRVADAAHPFSRARLVIAVATGRLHRTTGLRVRSADGPLRLARDGESFDGTEDFDIVKAGDRLAMYAPRPPRAPRPVPPGQSQQPCPVALSASLASTPSMPTASSGSAPAPWMDDDVAHDGLPFPKVLPVGLPVPERERALSIRAGAVRSEVEWRDAPAIP
jgi:hypothetical protein